VEKDLPAAPSAGGQADPRRGYQRVGRREKWLYFSYTLKNVIIAVGVGAVPSFIRLVRGSVLSIREQGYVEAAAAIGQRPSIIVFRHVLPNATAPVIVQATLNLASALLLAAGLGFFGLGVQPPTAERGAMLGDGRQYIFRAPALITYPGLAVFLAVLGFNLFGDRLRDALDPRMRVCLGEAPPAAAWPARQE
jgi:ABC-type dipeptide/oligopeptide/nickel transport system permease subunit